MKSHPRISIYRIEPSDFDAVQDSLPGNNILFVGGIPTDVIDVETPQLPTSFTLSQNYPNPFNPETQIGFLLPRSSFVTLDVFNVEGRRVRRLVNERLSAGSKVVTWDSRDDHGFQVSSGIYLYRITAGDFTESKKMILLK